MTKEEKHIWYDFLKKLPVTFHRQKVIGNYVVDFYCASANIVIEIDGSEHFTDKGKVYDKIRSDYLNSLGLTVLRYSNSAINNNFDIVCRNIARHIPELNEMQKED